MIFLWWGVHFHFQITLLKKNPNLPFFPFHCPTSSQASLLILVLRGWLLVNECMTFSLPPPLHPILCLPGLGNIHFYGQS